MGYAIDIKHIFLSFAQALFGENEYITWTLDPKTTKIIIGDEYFIANPLIEKFPTIIVKRSRLRWGMHSVDQRMSLDLGTGDKGFSDLLHGSITYNVMSSNAQSAERLADYLYEKLSGHRDQFRERNINKLTSISMGEEVVIKGPTDVDLVNIPINVGFVYNKQFGLTQSLTDITVTSLGTGDDSTLGSGSSGAFNKGFYIESVDFTVSGQEVEFITVPYNVDLTFEYVGETTLQTYTETESFLIDGTDSFTLAEVPKRYFELFTEYPVMSGLEV